MDTNMDMNNIIRRELEKLYSGISAENLTMASQILGHQIKDLVETFYEKLFDIPEIAPVLENAIVEKNLQKSLGNWILSIFSIHSPEDLDTLIERQKKIGWIHANINLKLQYFHYGISILKKEIFYRIYRENPEDKHLMKICLTIGELFDILISVIAESYFSYELVHENNELSLKVKGLSHNTAIECERLRTILFDWSRNTLTFLFHTPENGRERITPLQDSDFGLWVIYKSEYLSHPMSVSDQLKSHIRKIDEALLQSLNYRDKGESIRFSESIRVFNELITKTSWYISSIVDQALEFDTGTDPLTRLFNRRYLETILRRQTEISKRYGFPFAILLMDLDHFKIINDTYGHDAGDSVLKQFSEMLLLSLRASDFVFRYGGEEFLAVIGNIPAEEAQKLAEKIRMKCESSLFQIADERIIRLTCSIGITVSDGHPDYNRLIKRADTAMYQAKNSGRNTVIRV